MTLHTELHIAPEGQSCTLLQRDGAAHCSRGTELHTAPERRSCTLLQRDGDAHCSRGTSCTLLQRNRAARCSRGMEQSCTQLQSRMLPCLVFLLYCDRYLCSNTFDHTSSTKSQFVASFSNARMRYILFSQTVLIGKMCIMTGMALTD